MNAPLRLSAAILAVVLLCPGRAGAQEKRPEVCPAIDTPQPAAPRLRVFVDPTTGRLREPTPDELRELAEKRLSARQAALARPFEVITHPDGMQSVDLGDAFLFDVRLSTLPDGTTKLECLPRAARPSSAPEK